MLARRLVLPEVRPPGLLGSTVAASLCPPARPSGCAGLARGLRSLRQSLRLSQTARCSCCSAEGQQVRYGRPARDQAQHLVGRPARLAREQSAAAAVA